MYWPALILLGLLAIPANAAPPGTLISARAVANAPPDMQAWRVQYWTTNDAGTPIKVTGMVVAPPGARPAKPRPVLAWAHGSWGVAPACAPSLSDNFYRATAGLNAAVRRGYTVVAPDYPGLGSPMPHGYLVGRSEGRSVLDAVRAARGIKSVRAGAVFAVWGESQGGHAALWTGQLARAYAPDLRLMGVAAAAPTTDLVANLTAGGDPSVRAFITAFAAYSWSQYYGAPLSTLGGKSTQGIITRLAQNNCIELDTKPKITTMLGVAALRHDLKTVNLGKIQPWAQIARDNSPADRPYSVPFLIAQNPDDAIVGSEVTRNFARRLCANGAVLRYLPIRGKGHETSAADTAGATLDWIDARFAGAPGPSNCGGF